MRSFEAMSAVGIGCFVYDAALDHLVMIWRILNSGLLVCFFFLLPFAAFLKVFSPWVVILFLGSEPKAQALLPIASPLLVVVASFILLADGLRVIAGQALNGLSDMKMPALMMGLGHWGIGFPSALVFGLAMGQGILGFWWGSTMGVVAVGMIYLARFRWMVEYLSAGAPGNGRRVSR